MSILKSFCGIVAVTLAIGSLTIVLGQEHCLPGQLETPPCAAAVLAPDDPTATDQTETPPASVSVELPTLVEEALITLLLF